ncbi:MAG: FAD-dependent oxidoreductase [Actinomycetota bacterium]
MPETPDPDEREPYPSHDVIVIGGGPAAYTAMIYLAGEQLDAVCLEGFESGGQISRASKVLNYPGLPDSPAGVDIPDSMRRQAEGLGATFEFDEAHTIEAIHGDRFAVHGSMGSWAANALIVATGSRPVELGLESEKRLQNRGVAYCALCDGPFFTGKRVAVVGGGDASVEQAITLTNLGCKVVVIHRRDEFRAAQSGQSFLHNHPDVSTLTPYRVDEILATPEGIVGGIRVEHTETGEQHEETLDAVFVAIGHKPASDLVADLVDRTEAGHIQVRGRTGMTSCPGVFAAGDVIDPSYRQAVTAAASGCVAAIDAARWLGHRAIDNNLAAASTNR